MHAIWSGSISFGLVNIPIKLYSGSEESSLNLRMLHKKDLSPVRYAKVCRSEGKEISYAETVKGYEYQKNEFVVLEDKDFEKANVRATHTIEIIQFINEKELDIRYFEKPYYLEAEKTAIKAYALLMEGLSRSKKVGLAKFVLHNREHLGIVKVIDGVLVLNSLRFNSEIRDTSQLKVKKTEKLRTQEIKMALTLIKQLTKRYDPDDFKDNYRQELEEIIQAKASGKKAKPKGKPPVNTKAKDLMFVLKASLKEAKRNGKIHHHRVSKPTERRMSA